MLTTEGKRKRNRAFTLQDLLTIYFQITVMLSALLQRTIYIQLKVAVFSFNRFRCRVTLVSLN